MKRLWFFVAVFLALPPAARAQSIPDPSPALLDALAGARSMDLAPLVAWAAQPAAPGSPTGPAAAVELKILALAPGDRDAFLFWLNAHGRGALHAQGANDADIGIPYWPIDYALVPAPFPASVTPLMMPVAIAPPPTPTPRPRRHSSFGLFGALLPSLSLPIASSSSSSTTTTNTPNGYNQSTSSSSTSVSISGNPWEAIGSLIDASVDRSSAPPPAPAPPPWRGLPFAASSLGALSAPVTITRGFAAVRNDGTEGVACISFVSQRPVAATQVNVDIEVLDGLGFIKRVQALRRGGTFPPGVEIGGPQGPQSIHEARANCVIDGENSLTDLSDPFSGASAVVYAVRQVFYADGTSWLQPGANGWGP